MEYQRDNEAVVRWISCGVIRDERDESFIQSIEVDLSLMGHQFLLAVEPSYDEVYLLQDIDWEDEFIKRLEILVIENEWEFDDDLDFEARESFNEVFRARCQALRNEQHIADNWANAYLNFI